MKIKNLYINYTVERHTHTHTLEEKKRLESENEQQQQEMNINKNDIVSGRRTRAGWVSWEGKKLRDVSNKREGGKRVMTIHQNKNSHNEASTARF